MSRLSLTRIEEAENFSVTTHCGFSLKRLYILHVFQNFANSVTGKSFEFLRKATEKMIWNSWRSWMLTEISEGKRNQKIYNNHISMSKD